VVQRAWQQGRELALHGWIYSIEDGIIKDLHVDVYDRSAMPEIYSIY
jgi:carbonic anhydrase